MCPIIINFSAYIFGLLPFYKETDDSQKEKIHDRISLLQLGFI